MELALDIFLIIMVILQIIALIQLLYNNHKQHKNDKKFWDNMAEQEKLFQKELDILKDMRNCYGQNTLEDKENGDR